jgi:LPXTG-motif cell wall-anchored protein
MFESIETPQTGPEKPWIKYVYWGFVVLAVILIALVFV